MGAVSSWGSLGDDGLEIECQIDCKPTPPNSIHCLQANFQHRCQPAQVRLGGLAIGSCGCSPSSVTLTSFPSHKATLISFPFMPLDTTLPTAHTDRPILLGSIAPLIYCFGSIIALLYLISVTICSLIFFICPM